MIFGRTKSVLPAQDKALPGRSSRPFALPATHAVLGTPLEGDVPEGFQVAVFGLGCFWGEEETLWKQPGVWSTSVGYAGGITQHPTYEEVCSGRTGHAEVVRVVFDPAKVGYGDLLRVFWESHDPTQGMRQGNDIGTQYRSVIFYADESQREAAEASRTAYEKQLTQYGYGQITTSIVPLEDYYYAEDYHQQYLAKHVNGYRCHSATGVPFPDSV